MEDIYEGGEIPVENLLAPARKRTFFLIQVNDTKVGMVVFELYNDQVPITCEKYGSPPHPSRKLVCALF